MITLVIDCETYADPAAYSDEDQLTLVDAASARGMEVGKFIACAPALARIVLVGLEHVETGGRSVIYDTGLMDIDGDAAPLIGVKCVGCADERELLIAAHETLGFARRLVGFNSRSFDLPLLLLRAMRHGIEPAPIVRRAVYQKPWEDGAHLDVLSLLTFGGATGRYSLGVYSVGLGVENPKGAGDGASVGALVEARDGLALATYCLRDVAATVALARKAGALPAAPEQGAA